LKRLALILAMLIAPLGSAAQEENIVAGLSQNTVSITANFNGSEILIFGAVQRSAPAPEMPLGVIVTIEGPDQPLTVRRLDRNYGIWMNVEAVEVDAAPTFYAVATTAPFDEVISSTEDLRYRISISRAIRAVGTGSDRPGDFTDAVMRIRANAGLYLVLENTVNLRSETLFDTSIALPPNLVEGDYLARIFLTRGREVVASFETEIEVAKVGLERLIYNLAYERPLIYGLLSLFIAIVAGWSASAIFRYILNN
jgi:uncharacterized protein (TIGR02186 family)